MSLEVINTLKTSLEDTLSPRGLKFIGIAYLINLVSSVSNQSMASGIGLYEGIGSTYSNAAPLALGGPSSLWIGLSLIGSLAGIWLTLGLLRSFVSGDSEQDIQTEFFTDNLTMPFLNLIAGGLIFGLVVGIGFLLLIIPGIFLLVSLIFWSVYVAVEDENFIQGMKKSWEMARGNRVDLLLVGAGTLAVGLAATLLIGIPGALVGTLSSQLGSLIGIASGSFTTVFTVATLANTYQALK